MLALSIAIGAAAAALQQAEDPLAELARWIASARDPRSAMSSPRANAIDALVADARILAIASSERRREAFLALLDAAALAPLDADARPLAPSAEPNAALRRRASELAFDALRSALDSDRGGELAPWIAAAVLSSPSQHPAPRRRAALEALRERREPATLLAILACAASGEREVRDAALAALVGWQDDGVHRFLLSQLAHPPSGADWTAVRAALAHFGAARLAPDGAIAASARDVAAAAILSEEWRRAVRGLKLSAALDDRAAVPALIEGWSIWIARRERGAGSRRIEDEIHRALKARSGRSIGPFPERWRAWWIAASSRAPPAPERGEPQITRASFFGLRPVSDRLVMILDRSGSMAYPFGASGRSRYDEALAQMERLLADLGPSTRFRVVLFDDEVSAWRSSLQQATRDRIASAVEWCRANGPRGGTSLEPAVRHALRLSADGTPDLRTLEEDTAVVLCDGATAERSGWVAPLFDRVGVQACLVFHCVQIGAQGDGTLEALAQATGGDFARAIP